MLKNHDSLLIFAEKHLFYCDLCERELEKYDPKSQYGHYFSVYADYKICDDCENMHSEELDALYNRIVLSANLQKKRA